MLTDRIRTLVLYSSYLGTKKASYYTDWLDAFQDCPYFDVTARNIVPTYLKVSNPSKYRDPEGLNFERRLTAYQFFYEGYSRCYAFLMKLLIRNKVIWDFSEIPNYDFIVLLHSTNTASLLPLFLLESYLKNRKGKLLVFMGNEYYLMPEKIRFINNVEADFVASQLPKEAATWLYGDCMNSKVLSIPHALNSKVYKPYKDHKERNIDIGFIGDKYNFTIGDIERTELAEYFVRNDFIPKLNKDIRLGSKLRIPREEYVGFLNSARGTIGGESGTHYLEKTDKTQKKVEAFLSHHPKATFRDVYEKFFKNYSNPINGKAISSRHFEAVGTKTCQILLEGNYNGILKPDTHYISLRKDYSNMNDVIKRFNDKSYVQKMVDDTYKYVIGNHTLGNRIHEVWKEVS